MDSQQVFDQVYEHLAKQKRPSVYSSACVLRGDNHTKCAIGCLIPDDKYMVQMEIDSGLLGDYLQFNNDPGLTHTWIKEHLKPNEKEFGLLRELQKCHDVGASNENPKLWVTALYDISIDYDLKFNKDDFAKKLADPLYCY